MTRRIPLFPLSTVLYPGLILPLHIFEPRYRGLVQRLMDEPEGSPREFGVVAIRDGREVGVDGVRALFPIGCAATLREVEPYEDGRFDITTVGTTRFAVRDVDLTGPLWEAEIEDLSDPIGGESDELEALGHAVTRGFARYRAALQGTPEEYDELATSGLDSDEEDEDELSIADPTVLSYAVAAAMILEVPDKQQLLAAESTAVRLREERRLLERERGVIRAIPSLPAVEVAQIAVSPN